MNDGLNPTVAYLQYHKLPQADFCLDAPGQCTHELVLKGTLGLSKPQEVRGETSASEFSNPLKAKRH